MKYQDKIQAVFKVHKEVNEVYVTEDGQVFLSENYANAYAVKEGGKRREKPLKVSKITRKDLNKPKEKKVKKTEKETSEATEPQSKKTQTGDEETKNQE